MGPNELPILSLQLRDMQYQINVCLDRRHEEIKAMIDSAMSRAIPEIGRQLDHLVHDAVMKAVDRVIDRAADDAVDVLASRASQQMTEALEQAIRERFKV